METVAPFAEIIEEVRKAGGESSQLCYQCGKCDVVCPWNKVRDFSIRRIVRQAVLGLPEIELEDMWLCTTCGTCPQACPRGVGQIDVGVALRRIAAEYGVFAGSAEALPVVQSSLSSDGNPLSEERGTRDAWAEGLGVKPFAEDMEVLFFVGCYYSYDPRIKKIGRALAEVLNAAGVSYGILGSEESCCGESIRKAGNEGLFRTLAKENIKRFIERGVKKILVASPHCYHAFKNEYPEFMVSFEVVHATEFLLELIEQGRLEITKEVPRRITFHDPCYLGRHNGLYDPPRDLLAKIPGLELVEMAESRENSLCCGGGGGRIWMDTPVGERFSDLRVSQAKAVGASSLVTTCPYCITNFEASLLTMEEEGLPVIQDVAELVRAGIEVGS